MSFKAAQAKIAAKEGVSKKAAGAILAKSSRNASAKAKRKNPKLKKVKGQMAHPVIKAGFDLSAVGILAGYFSDHLPAIATGLTAIYYTLQIFSFFKKKP